jgi:hypothetical protein
MQRTALLMLLIASLLFAGTLQAQRGGGGFRGGFAGGSVGVGFGGARNGFLAGHPRLHNFRNFSTALVPFWYGDPYGYEPPVELSAPAPPLVIVQRDKSESPAQNISPAKPQVIEIPGNASLAASEPLPPAIFILKSGQRLEARRYTLTEDSLCLIVDRQQRTVPVSMLDVDATVAADHARGIDMRVPADRNEIFLGF